MQWPMKRVKTTGKSVFFCARRRRALLSFLAAFVLLVSVAGIGQALIDPDYTPVNLTADSRAIVFFTIGPVEDDEEAVPGRDIQLLHGPAADALSITAEDGEIDMIFDEAGFFYPDGRDRFDVLLFVTSPGGDDGDDPWGEGAAGPLLIGGRWYRAVAGEDGVWVLEEDPEDLTAVWNGGTLMLKRACEYILKAPDPIVPARADIFWDEPVRIGQFEDKVSELIAVDLDGDRNAGLFALSSGGDRFFQYDPASGRFADRGTDLGLETASLEAVWADVTGDGALDLVSWNGEALRIFTRAEGRLSELPGAPVLDERDRELLNGLSSLRGPDSSRSTLLISRSSDAPLLLTLDDQGAWTMQPLAEGEADHGDLGDGHPCLVADFTGDGRVDVLHPFERGGLLYRGDGEGSFRAPESVGQAASMPGPVRTALGDLTQNGQLDVVFFGQRGVEIWSNDGEGRFVQAWNQTGEASYSVRPGATAGAVGDFNGNGLMDMLILYEMAPLHLYFTRGFGTFGWFGAPFEEDFGQEILPDSMFGQQAGLLEDLTGDGAVDLALVLDDGSIWVTGRNTEHTPGLALRISLPPGAPHPVTLEASTPYRSLGARKLAPGRSYAYIAQHEPGPLTLTWRDAEGRLQTEKTVLGGLFYRGLGAGTAPK